jgi:hypothetical protein
MNDSKTCSRAFAASFSSPARLLTLGGLPHAVMFLQ